MPALDRLRFFDTFRFPPPRERGDYIETIVVMGIGAPTGQRFWNGTEPKDHLMFFYKSLHKPLPWPQVNRMRAIRYHELQRMCDLGVWSELSPLKISATFPTRRLYHIKYAMEEWLLSTNRA